jgi:hypothetical protein
MYRAVCKRAYQTKFGKLLEADSAVSVKVFLLERLSTDERARIQQELSILKQLVDVAACEELLDAFHTQDDLILVKRLLPVIPIANGLVMAAGESDVSESLAADMLHGVFSACLSLKKRAIIHSGINVSMEFCLIHPNCRKKNSGLAFQFAAQFPNAHLRSKRDCTMRALQF